MGNNLREKNSNKTKRILRECGAFVEGGHFVYSSGRHGDFYINKDALYMHPVKFDDVVYMLSQNILSSFSVPIDIVLSPTMGGILVGQGVAHTLSLEIGSEVLFAYSEPKDGDPFYRTIRRKYDSIIRDANVLLVDDVVTTGTTMVGMAKSVLRRGGKVVGGASICDRGQNRCIKFYPDQDSLVSELNLLPLLTLDLRTFSSDDCPFCKSGRPIDPMLGTSTSYFYGDDLGRVSE